MPTIVKLKIADIVIELRSRFGLKPLSKEEQKLSAIERFNNFFYRGSRRPQIKIKVEIVDALPEINKAQTIFVTNHFQSGNENWRLQKQDSIYIYKSPLQDKQQLMLVNKYFNRVTAYLLPKKEKGKVWGIDDIIYDFLQVLLINYFARRKDGIFVHSIGVKDLDGMGLLFAGKSGCGKTTTAKLWHKHSRATVLNDDRIIVRKHKNRFFIHGSPWHGEFSDYLDSRIDSAPLKKLFFIHHAPENRKREIGQKQAFNALYPALFPTFWDKQGLVNIVSFCDDLIKNVPCCKLGFVNDKRVINFVRTGGE